MPGRITPEKRIRQFHEADRINLAKPRERILAEAFTLFYLQGIRSVGVDLIIHRSQVAKASFYRHFPSKESLILVYLDRRYGAWLSWLSESVDRRAAKPEDKLIAIFDCLAEQFEDPEYRGCVLAKTVHEVGTDSPAVRERIKANKATLRRYVEDLATQARIPNPAALATTWLVLMDGAMTAALSEEARTVTESSHFLARHALGYWKETGVRRHKGG